jgi:hypothetical protein
VAEQEEQRSPGDVTRGTGQESDSHRHQHKERVFEDGRDAPNDPRPGRDNLSGTPLGSDPRE